MALPSGFTVSDTMLNYSLSAPIALDVTFPLCRAICVGVTGDITAVMGNNDNVVFKAVPVGILPIRVTQCKSTLGGASAMVALY